ncbi:aminotransferase class III-fold pyridoxal phosphate-dependent enzyme [Streptomyces sp. NPDC088252]|uniref:aminotransferase class III-fold pyridoxal phosphate-dependent enzyme n=1 Tax=Streptomyces sp. NPDC088252 TaxID=3365845 RepID=UPI003829FCB4
MVSSWFRFTGHKHAPEPTAGMLDSNTDVVENTVVLQYGDLGGLERLREHADDLACVILEPMPPSTTTFDVEFLSVPRKVCTESSLVFDEVVTGFRVAYGGAQTMAGIEPDLTCLGKIIGGGLPCGAVRWWDVPNWSRSAAVPRTLPRLRAEGLRRRHTQRQLADLPGGHHGAHPSTRDPPPVRGSGDQDAVSERRVRGEYERTRHLLPYQRPRLGHARALQTLLTSVNR